MKKDSTIRRGFTLLEVIIGITIITIITTQILYISSKNHRRMAERGQRLRAYYVTGQVEDAAKISSIKSEIFSHDMNSGNYIRKSVCFDEDAGGIWTFKNNACTSYDTEIDGTKYNRSIKMSAVKPGDPWKNLSASPPSRLILEGILFYARYDSKF